MSKIIWRAGVTGDWTTGADWVGGTVPGPADTVRLGGNTASPYTITLDTAVSVAALVMREKDANLSISGTLTAPRIALKAGNLRLDNGTLSGTVTQTGGHLLLATGNSTLDGVTWAGAFKPKFIRAKHGAAGGTLTIDHGLTLIGANGTGAGTADLRGPVILNDVATLDNASIGAGTVIVQNSPTLTLGAGLTVGSVSPIVDRPDFLLSDGETLVNDGILDDASVNNDDADPLSQPPAGAFVNNGQINLDPYADARFWAQSVTNNGTITVNGGIIPIDPDTWQTPGAQAKILLNNATVEWDSAAAITTAQLETLAATQNITVTGKYGFAVENLDNSGATLRVGTATALGTLSGGDGFITHISGGTIVSQGIKAPIDGVTLQELTFHSNNQVLDLSSSTFDDVVVTGAHTLTSLHDTFNGGTLSGVGSLISEGGLILNGVDITGAGGDGAVSISNNYGSLGIRADQDVSGYSFSLNQTALHLDAGASTGSAQIGFTGGGSIFGATDGSESSTISAATTITTNFLDPFGLEGGTRAAPLLQRGTILASDVIVLGPNANAAYLDNSGDITATGSASGFVTSSQFYSTSHLTNSGTIAVTGGKLQLAPSRVVNTGSISVTDGTLVLSGPLTVGALTEFADPGSQVLVAGALDLGGASITLGQGGIPAFGLTQDPQEATSVSDGTLTVPRGTQLASNAPATISAALVNNGVLLSDFYFQNLTIAGAVSGTGTFELSNSGLLTLDTPVDAQQTVAFIGQATEFLTFGSAVAADGFAGKIAGFAVGDGLEFDGQTLIGGQFSGDSIVASFSSGATLTLATTTALKGKLKVLDGQSLRYESAKPALPDWVSAEHAGAIPAQQSLCAMGALNVPPSGTEHPIAWLHVNMW